MTRYRFIEQLPDLIQADSYADDPAGCQMRLRICLTTEGIEVLGDALRPDELEALLEMLEPEVIEQMLCG